MAFEIPPDPVPPYLSPGDIAAACRLSWKSTLTELKSAARAEQSRSKQRSRLLEYRPGPADDGSGGRWRVDATKLQELLPSMYDRVYAYYSQATRRFPALTRARSTPGR
jgi:hypothetical protein